MKVGLTLWDSKQESGGPELWDTLAHKQCFLTVLTWLFPDLGEDSRLTSPTTGTPPNVRTDSHMCQALREQAFHHPPLERAQVQEGTSLPSGQGPA